MLNALVFMCDKYLNGKQTFDTVFFYHTFFSLACSKIQRADLLIKYNTKLKNGQLAPQTIASLYCVGSETLAGQLKCQSGGWIVKQPSSRWRSTCITTTTCMYIFLNNTKINILIQKQEKCVIRSSSSPIRMYI